MKNLKKIAVLLLILSVTAGFAQAATHHSQPDATLRLSWSREWAQIKGFMRRAAIGETLAHLVLLERDGRARREGRDPVRWYAAVPAQVRG